VNSFNNYKKFSYSIKGTLLLISMYFLPEPGGGASAALNRATILKMIGYNVFILCGFPTYPNGKIIEPKYHKKFVYVETIQNITVIRLRLLQIKHEGYIKRFILFSNFVIVSILLMPKILKITGKIDIVYSLAPIIFSSFSGFIYSKLTNAFFIYDVPDLWPEELVAFKSTFSPLITVIGKIIAKLSYSLPDIIITISNSAAKIIYDNYKPRPPIYVIPIGVNPSLFPKLLKKESRTNLINQKIFPKELQEKFIILYAGLISPAQEVENLIILAEKIKDIHDIQVVILGDGENKPKIAKKIQSMNNVHLLNYQPRNMMPLIYSSVDIGTVLLSKEPIFDIAFPTKFYEYIACNKPVLAICKGELAKIINFNNIGYAVDSDKIDELIPFIKKIKDCSDLFHIIEKNVYDTLQQFSLNTLSMDFKKVLEMEYKNKKN
jgi:colanic acid biosynthesis glycosyl transferase WcaI